MKHLNIILANAPIKLGNKGCVALSMSAMYIIDRILDNKGIAYTLYLPDSMYHDGKIHDVEIKGKKISFYDTEYPVGINLKETIKNKLIEIKRRCSFAKIFRTADYILDIGQGDSFADIYGTIRFKKIDRIHKLAQKYNKPYCLLPQTIGPFEDSVIRSEAHKSIAGATLCMARDKRSYDYVVNNIPEQKNINEYIDVAFLLPYKKIDFDSQYVHVGLNISSLLWHGGYTQDNQFGLNVNYQEVIRNIIDFFLQQKDVQLHLIPHVVHDERKVENDYAVSYDLWREYNHENLLIAPFFFSPIDAKDYISGMDFFMGSRMHATIAAFSSGVPVVPMAYSRKFNGLFEDTLNYKHMVDMKVQSSGDMHAIIKESYKNRNHLKEEIALQITTTIKEREKHLSDDLKMFFGLK